MNLCFKNYVTLFYSYAIMCKCWKDRPFDRPSFFQLNVALERIIDTKSTHVSFYKKLYDFVVFLKVYYFTMVRLVFD